MTALKRTVPMKAAASVAQYDFISMSTGATQATAPGGAPFGMATLTVDNSSGAYDAEKLPIIRDGPGRAKVIVMDQTVATGGEASSNIAVGDALQFVVTDGADYCYLAKSLAATSKTVAWALEAVTGDTSGDTTDLIEVDFCMNAPDETA